MCHSLVFVEISNQTSQAQQPLNPTPPAVNSGRSKVIPIILGIAAVIVIAIGAYVLGTKQTQPVVQNSVQPTPTPDQNQTSGTTSTCPLIGHENQNTLINTNYHYSISFPESLVVYSAGRDGDPSKSSAVIIASKDDDLFEPSCPFVEISVWPKSYYSTLEDFVQYNYKREKNYSSIVIGQTTIMNNNITDLSDTTFLSESARKFSETINRVDYKTATIKNSQEVSWTMLEHNGNYFYILSPKDRSLDFILSTFKFTDQP